MRRVLGTIGLALLLFVSLVAQQTGLTEGQIKAAEIEVPELAKLFELTPGMTVADVGAGFGAWTCASHERSARPDASLPPTSGRRSSQHCTTR